MIISQRLKQNLIRWSGKSECLQPTNRVGRGKGKKNENSVCDWTCTKLAFCLVDILMMNFKFSMWPFWIKSGISSLKILSFLQVTINCQHKNVYSTFHERWESKIFNIIKHYNLQYYKLVGYKRVLCICTTWPDCNLHKLLLYTDSQNKALGCKIWNCSKCVYLISEF